MTRIKEDPRFRFFVLVDIVKDEANGIANPDGTEKFPGTPQQHRLQLLYVFTKELSSAQQRSLLALDRSYAETIRFAAANVGNAPLAKISLGGNEMRTVFPEVLGVLAVNYLEELKGERR